MNSKKFVDISIRGRIAYVILCFENYVKVKYPDVDMQPVLRLMWSVVDSSDYIDNSAYKYLEIVPECLFEKDHYSTDVFEELTEDEYNRFTKILNSDDPDLNSIMMSVYDIAMEYAYTNITNHGNETYEYLDKVIAILNNNSIPLPDIDKVSMSRFSESEGWGHCLEPKATPHKDRLTA